MEKTFTFTIRYTKSHGPKEYMKGLRAKQFGANQETTIDQFVDKIRHGYGFSTPANDVDLPIELQNQKQNFDYTGLDTFMKSQLLVYDIDDAPRDMYSFIKHLPRNFHPTIAYTTESNLKDGKGYRFRLIYIFKSSFDSVVEYMTYHKSLAYILKLGPSNDTSAENGVQTIFGNPTDNLEIYKHTKLKRYDKSDITVRPLSDAETDSITKAISRAQTKRIKKISEALSMYKQRALIAEQLVVSNTIVDKSDNGFLKGLSLNELDIEYVRSVIDHYKDTYGDRYITCSADFSDGKPYEQNVLKADLATLFGYGEYTSRVAVRYKNRCVYTNHRKRLLSLWANYFIILKPNLDLEGLTFNLLLLFNLHCINSEALFSSYGVYNEIIHGKDLINIAQDAIDNKEKNRILYIEDFKCQKIKFNPKLLDEVKKKEGVSGQKANAILKERYGLKKQRKRKCAKASPTPKPKASPELIRELTTLYASTTTRKRERLINQELVIRGYRTTSRSQIDRMLKANL